MHTVVKSVAAMILSVPLVYAQADDGFENSSEPDESIKMMRPVPMTDGVMAIKDKLGKTIFASFPNARFQFRGNIFDSWTKQVISTLEDVNNAYLVPIEMAGVKTEDLATFQIGNANIPVQGTIFVDALDENSQKLLQLIKSKEDSYHFNVVMLATNKEGSVGRLKALWCAKDQEMAVDDLINGTSKVRNVAQKTKCPTDPMLKGAVTQNLLNIKITPYLYRADGLMYGGIPKDLDAWLNFDIHAQEKK